MEEKITCDSMRIPLPENTSNRINAITTKDLESYAINLSIDDNTKAMLQKILERKITINKTKKSILVQIITAYTEIDELKKRIIDNVEKSNGIRHTKSIMIKTSQNSDLRYKIIKTLIENDIDITRPQILNIFVSEAIKDFIKETMKEDIIKNG